MCPSPPVKLCGRVRPLIRLPNKSSSKPWDWTLIRLFTKTSSKQGVWISIETLGVRVSEVWLIRRGFRIWQEYPLSADTRWPFSELGWGQARYLSITNYSFSAVSSKLEANTIHDVDQGAHDLSTFTIYFRPPSSQNPFTERDKLELMVLFWFQVHGDPSSKRRRHGVGP